MPFRLQLAILLGTFSVPCLAIPAAAEQPTPITNPSIQQTAFNRPAAVEAQPRSVRFGRQPTRVGDQIEQTVAIEMRLKLTMRRANELIGKNQTTVRTSQRRIVTTTAIDAGRTMAVSVQYPEATKQVVAAEAPSVPPQSNGETEPPLRLPNTNLSRSPFKARRISATANPAKTAS